MMKSGTYNYLGRIILGVACLFTLSLSSSAIYAAQFFFDDFEDGTLDKWTVISGEWEIVTEGSNQVAHLTTANEINRCMMANGQWPDDVVITAKLKGDAHGDDGSADMAVGCYSNSDASYFFYVLFGGGGYAADVYIREYANGTETELAHYGALTLVDNVWYNVKISLSDGSIHAKIWEDGSSEPSGWQIEHTGLVPYGNNIFVGGVPGNDDEEFWFDDVAVETIGGSLPSLSTPMLITLTLLIAISAILALRRY